MPMASADGMRTNCAMGIATPIPSVCSQCSPPPSRPTSFLWAKGPTWEIWLCLSGNGVNHSLIAFPQAQWRSAAPQGAIALRDKNATRGARLLCVDRAWASQGTSIAFIIHAFAHFRAGRGQTAAPMMPDPRGPAGMTPTGAVRAHPRLAGANWNLDNWHRERDHAGWPKTES
jgi:hypothetical protein